MSTLSAFLSLMAFASSTFAAALPKTDTFRVSGNSVTAFFTNPVPSCIETVATVSASEETGHTSGNPKQFAGSVFLNITKRNLCTGETLLDAFAFELLTGSKFQVSPNLATATLNLNISAFDVVSAKALDVVVALAWTATEGVSSGHTTSHSRFGGTTYHSSSTGTTRGALATGQFSLLGANFAGAPAVFAFISKYSDGSVSITH